MIELENLGHYAILWSDELKDKIKELGDGDGDGDGGANI